MFGGTSSAHHGGKPQSRCLSALADAERHRFLLGSTSLREENEIQLLELNEETNQASCVVAFAHPEPVWTLSPSPRDAALLFTTGHSSNAKLWRMPADCASGEADAVDHAAFASLEEMTSVPGTATSILWHPGQPSAAAETVAALSSAEARVFDVANPAKTVGSLMSATRRGFVAGAWDPHHNSTLCVVEGFDVHGWDVRGRREAYRIADAHKYAARDVDYNPNKPMFIVTAGNDRLIKFWDLRRLTEPVRMLAGHTHWVWTAQYNRFHDQLLLSAGTDSLVNLWRVSSISSAPLLELEAEASSSPDTGDGRIRTFDEHEESVYAVAWSACDAWVFASLSYDGRVVMNHVPSTEKYKILL